MLKKLYDKSKIWFAVLWIVAYCVLMSVADSLSALIGIEKSVTLAVGIVLSAVLLLFLYRHRLFDRCGICAPRVSARKVLYYLPLLIMLTTNLWYGVTLNYGPLETVLYILSMLAVGLLEEIIFRGLLFGAMREENERVAVIVSSFTFGIGHIINLVNGSGAELVPNLLQVVYATAAGFMFVMIYCRTESLIACIVAHGVFNALSVFANENSAAIETRIIFSVILTVLTAGYGIYIAVTMKKEGAKNCEE